MKRISCIFLCGLAAVFLIAGCVKKEKVSLAQTTLRLAFYGDLRNKPFGEALIGAFEKSHPSIKIKPVFMVEYHQKLLTMIAGGDAPDVMVLFPPVAVDLVYRETLLNLDPFMDQDQEFQSFRKDIHPGALEAARHRGVHYAVPFWTNSLVLFYNKELFDKEGIEYPDGSWDWDKLVAAGKKLTRDVNNDGRMDQYGFFTHFQPSDTFGGLYQYIRKNGGRLFNEDMSECLITDPENMEAVRWCLDLITKHKITPSPFAADERLRDYEQSFLSGRLAMTISGRWSIPWFSDAKFEWGCAPQPKGKVEFKPSGAMLLGAYGRTKYPEECWEFLRFMMGKEAQEIVCESKADMPIRMSVARSPKFLNWSSRPKENKIFLEELEGAEEFPHFPKETEWLTNCDRELELVILGRKSLESACQEIAKEYRQYRPK